MFKIGCHLSASKGFMNMGRTIVKMGGNTFQYFSRNPRGGNAKALRTFACFAARTALSRYFVMRLILLIHVQKMKI